MVTNQKGLAAFERHYQELFGKRSESLLASLVKPHPLVLLIDPHHTQQVKQQWLDKGLAWTPLVWFPTAVLWPADVPMGTLLPGVTEGWIYPLSPSSLVPVVALSAKASDTVFDACAAPGGKTVALVVGVTAKQPWQTKSIQDRPVVANDLSPERVKRLKAVVRQFNLHEVVEVNQGPAEIVARRIDRQFTKILIDAPCSSEAHVLASPKHSSQWSHKRIKQLQQRQTNLIIALLLLLTPGGRLVYSTCAITPEENEQVCARVMSVIDPSYHMIPIDFSATVPGNEALAGYGMETECGWRVWPDIHGFDPMFVAVWERKK